MSITQNLMWYLRTMKESRENLIKRQKKPKCPECGMFCIIPTGGRIYKRGQSIYKQCTNCKYAWEEKVRVRKSDEGAWP